MKLIILAGGEGTRLWPISRKSKPKQFCQLFDSKTMIELVWARLKKQYQESDIYISVSSSLHDLVHKSLPHFSEERIIIESQKSDTGPAMAYIAHQLAKNFPNEPIAFIPSDHYIKNEAVFLDVLKTGEELIKETGKIIDVGVEAKFPSTNLGYIKVGQKIDERQGIEVYEFKEQKEKPDFETAQSYLKKGGYLWHANYFMGTPRKFLELYQKYAPEIYQRLEGDYAEMPKISIDYALMEKIDPNEVLILKANMDWSDIGAFDVLYDQLKSAADENKNIIQAKEWLGIDTSGSLIYGQPEKIIATIGIDDLVIIDTPDALLICPKGRAQDVKKLVEKLKEKDYEKYI